MRIFFGVLSSFFYIHEASHFSISFTYARGLYTENIIIILKASRNFGFTELKKEEATHEEKYVVLSSR